MVRKILACMALLVCFTSIGNATPSAGEVLNILKSNAKDMIKYRKTKNFNVIQDGRVRMAVTQFCEKGCNRYTCKIKPQVKQVCSAACPANSVKHCVAG